MIILCVHSLISCSLSLAFLVVFIMFFFFFFSSRRRHTRLRISDWSSDVCSSDLSRDNGRSLYGIFVRIAGKEGQALAVTAAQGTFLATDDPDTIIFRLKNGVLVHDSPKYEAPRILTFNSQARKSVV